MAMQAFVTNEHKPSTDGDQDRHPRRLDIADCRRAVASLAEGDPTCVDQLIGFVRPLPPEDQARVDAPWLVEIRQPAPDAGLLPDWQRIVDALVVAGVTRLAPYSE
jgi:hypothetical protein